MHLLALNDPDNCIFLDTETTGINPGGIVELSITDIHGKTLMDTLINPKMSIPHFATKVHGITNKMVSRAPTFAELAEEVASIFEGKHLVDYNSAFDLKFLQAEAKRTENAELNRHLCGAASVNCAMQAFSEQFGTAMGFGRKRKSLDFASTHFKHQWEGAAHRALADTLACRTVWIGVALEKGFSLPEKPAPVRLRF